MTQTRGVLAAPSVPAFNHSGLLNIVRLLKKMSWRWQSLQIFFSKCQTLTVGRAKEEVEKVRHKQIKLAPIVTTTLIVFHCLSFVFCTILKIFKMLFIS